MPSLRALLGLGPVPKTAASGDFPALPLPHQPLCIIGDLHGMADLLEAMLARIADQPNAATARIVLVGDLIDRGPDSAAVLRRVYDLCLQEPDHVTCLMGNHERMMLDFLAKPATHAGRWLNAGGQETLHSFGIKGRMPGADPASRFTALAGALRAALPPYLVPWMASLPLYWQTQGLAVVHADAHPALDMTAQPATTLLWGTPKPAPARRKDGLWLAHGHVIVPQVHIADGRIAVDTGAWCSGVLSALWLDRDGARVITVGAA